MTYNVFGWTLNLTQSINLAFWDSVCFSLCGHIQTLCQHDILQTACEISPNLHFTKLIWVDFEVKRSRSPQTTYGQMSTLRGIFSAISGTHWHIIMKLITVIHYQVLTTLMTYSMSWVQRSRSTTFFKMHVFPVVQQVWMLQHNFCLQPISSIQGREFKGQGHRQHFKCTFCRRHIGILLDCLPLKTISFVIKYCTVL